MTSARSAAASACHRSPAAGSSIDCDTVSGYMSLGCADCPADVDFDSVSGSLTLTLPAGSQYTLAFDSVSGRIITTNFTPAPPPLRHLRRNRLR